MEQIKRSRLKNKLVLLRTMGTKFEINVWKDTSAVAPLNRFECKPPNELARVTITKYIPEYVKKQEK